jgi:membrane fusion protein
MTSRLFRQEVIEAGRDRLAGKVVAATPPGSRIYVGVTLAVALVLVAILIFGQYASRAAVKGVVAYDAGIARVYPSSSGEIRAIHVREGDYVEAGTPLVTVAFAQGESGIDAQLSEMARQQQELERQEALAGNLGSAEVRALAAQRSGLVAAVTSLERQRSFAAAQVPLAEAATRRAAALAAEGAGTQRQVEDSRATLLARRAEAESLSERIAEQRRALSEIDGRIGQRGLEAERMQSEVATRRAELGEERAALIRTDRLVLTAPIAGEVGDIASEVGQRARPETSLVTIVPRGSQLEVWLYAPSRAVGFVRPGQEVRLLFDAFPYQKYGAGRGRVTAVSRVAVEPASIDSALKVDEPVFRIRVAIDQAPRVAGGERLRPGMTLSANLVLERRSLWEVLFKPVATALGA